MFELPLIYFLYAFYVFAAFWALLSLIVFLHLLRYGLREVKVYLTGLVFIVGSLLIGVLLVSSVGQVDWSETVSIAMPAAQFNTSP